MSRIVILTGQPLSRNPRVVKEAGALSRAGHRVEVLGAWFEAGVAEEDLTLAADGRFTFTPVVDFTRDAAAARLARLARRGARKLAGIAFASLRIESGRLLGHAVPHLARQARARDADLYVAHSEAGLFAGELLATRGASVAVDMEDWFSEDLPPQARRERPVELLRRLESRRLREAAYATCPSHAMAQALQRAYVCERPVVVYNAFPWAEREHLDGRLDDRRDRSRPSIHWYSQTLGMDRGLEDLLAALALVSSPAELHLRGRPSTGFGEWLAARVPATWRERVFVHDLVSNAELLSRIAEHDVGFAGETTLCPSRDLTVTNKMLQYLLAGLAVVASDTGGQAEVAAAAPDAVRLHGPGDAAALARNLEALLSSPGLLAHARAAALAVARDAFCWERQEPRLLGAIEGALQRRLG